jgi:glycine dehydrogenase subunit 1
MSLLGAKGLRAAAEQCLAKSRYAADVLGRLPGFSLRFEKPFFKEFLLSCPVSAETLVRKLLEEKVLAGVPLSRFATLTSFPEDERERLLLVAVTEKRKRKEIDGLCEAIADAASSCQTRK